jgi:lysophospholipase L1-like esterase
LRAQPAAPAPAPDLPANAKKAPAAAPLNPALPTLFIAGDSTAARGSGWGAPFAEYLDLAKINLANRAISGRSSRTFINEGAWDRIVADLKAGDTVLIQFGHNDLGALNDEPPPPLRARGTIPGIGEETKAIDNVLTKQHEVVHTYGWYIRKMIADTKAKGATPILLSLTVRNIWENGKVERGASQYRAWTAEIAKQASLSFIDLTTIVADDYERRGEEKVKAFFPRDHTHTSPEGSDLNASYVIAGLRGLPGAPFDQFLSAKGRGVAAIK